ncbi:FAD-dependent oxidoreductase [Paenibacillus nasutitermitis]|uniref:FAD-dependent oxidoreductase n=1 Tax=Paenibacillus nasutitermitis TaxID=1652958 RepID=A0A916YUU6_9BACL|nr:FAD-dependent oxidoreductase [Paenibacillus nasutitermitis]GGD62189.1 hypothetical protein GCM10010911_20110 [Paenibacillus nasutitermitis]
MSEAIYDEPSKEIPILVTADVVVCGGGPAGVAAAIASARGGARTVLLENQGCLGGIWTSGLLSWIIDAGNKKGIMQEIMSRLDRRKARIPSVWEDFTYDAEEMKLLLEEMCVEAGVTVMLHTRVVHAAVEGARRLSLAITESKSGRQAWAASIFIDATGDGDLAARAGCRFDLGRPLSEETQPMSLMALVAGLDPEKVAEYTMNGVSESPRERLLERMEKAGHRPSYASPSLFHIRDQLFALMANHEYGASALHASQVTKATMHARKELHRLIDGLRSLGDAWANIRIVNTASHIGVREGRRIHGRYTVNERDLLAGATHEDAICRVRYGIDIHSTNPEQGNGFGDDGKKSLPYDIPFRALIAADVDGLLMAGRCISGDFIAHSSYRVTGNAVAMGQAAGAAAAIAAITNVLPQHLNGADITKALQRLEETN